MSDQPQRFECFATPVWRVPNNAQLDLDAKTQAVKAEQQSDPQGTEVSNRGGRQSRMQLNAHPAFQVLVKHILQHASAACQDWGVDFQGYPPVLNTLWASVNGPRDYNQTHHHWGFPIPNFNVLSGAFYVRCSPESGAIRFIDERPSTKYVTCYSLPALGPASRLLGEYFTINPLPGDLLMFPAWLDHKVAPNESEQDRISLSFNVSIPQEVIQSSPRSP